MDKTLLSLICDKERCPPTYIICEGLIGAAAVAFLRPSYLVSRMSRGCWLKGRWKDESGRAMRKDVRTESSNSNGGNTMHFACSLAKPLPWASTDSELLSWSRSRGWAMSLDSPTWKRSRDLLRPLHCIVEYWRSCTCFCHMVIDWHRTLMRYNYSILGRLGKPEKQCQSIHCRQSKHMILNPRFIDSSCTTAIKKKLAFFRLNWLCNR